jgi:hypothetical protein
MNDPWQDFLKLLEVKPEETLNALAEVGGGATVDGIAKGILEGVFYSDPNFWSGRFPFIPMPVLPDKLPPLDDTLVALVGPVVAALGALAGSRDAFRFGAGLALYGVPSWFRVLLSRVLSDPDASVLASSFESMGPPGIMRTYA